MRTIEVYIVKENGINSFELKNRKGIGFSNLNRSMPINDDEVVDGDEYEIITPIIPDDDEEHNFVVKLNGKELEYINDYNVINYKIIFNNPLMEGDKIEIYDSILNSVKVVTKNSYNRNALFKIFSSNINFKFNHTYEFVLPVQGKLFSTEFETEHDPFYTTVKKIRLDTGDLLNKVSDNQIAALIYQYSKEVQDVLGDDADSIPVYASNVVRYKTDIDLCWAIYLSISGKYGVKSKKVGTIEIEKNTKVPYIETMVKRFKELLAPNEELLNSDQDTVLSFVKAKSTEYTVPNRGVF